MIDSVIGRIGEVFDIGLWAQWFAELDRTFAFLLLLPFVVAVVGVWAAYRDRSLGQAEEAAARPADGHREERGDNAGANREPWRGPALR